MEKQSAKKSAEELLVILAGMDKVQVTFGKEEFFQKMTAAENPRNEDWVSASAYFYDKKSNSEVLIPSINFNGADLVKKFEEAIANGNKNFTLAVKVGEVKEVNGFSNLPVYVQDIERYQKTIDFAGDITKVTKSDNSATISYTMVGKSEKQGEKDPFVKLVVTESNKAGDGLELATGKKIVVRGDLVTTFNGTFKNAALFPKIIARTKEELAEKKEAKKKPSMKVS